MLLLLILFYIYFIKKSKKGVDMGVKVRYNGGSLSKSTFSTSTKRNGKRGNVLRSLIGLQNILKDSPINNLETIKILKTETSQTSFAS